MPPKSPDELKPTKRTIVTWVVFNGPAELKCYDGFVNRIDQTKDKPTVLVNSARKEAATVEMYIEAGVLYIGDDKFPVNGGKVVQYR